MGSLADACTFLRVLARYITSDCDAVAIIHDAQGYAKTAEDAVADVLKAGTRSLLFFSIRTWINPYSHYMTIFLFEINVSDLSCLSLK
jgi:hypothetical protein